MEFQFRTRECIEIVSCDYPARSELIRRLYVDLNLGREHPFALPAAVYIHGDHGTGKTAVLGALLDQLPHRSVTVDCVECFTPKILYETLLNELFEHRLSAATQFASYARCDNARDFVDALQVGQIFVLQLLLIINNVVPPPQRRRCPSIDRTCCASTTRNDCATSTPVCWPSCCACAR